MEEDFGKLKVSTTLAAIFIFNCGFPIRLNIKPGNETKPSSRNITKLRGSPDMLIRFTSSSTRLKCVNLRQG